ncbi:MAG: hypothetical protein ABFS86_16555 [Planctomycetota bacterium]
MHLTVRAGAVIFLLSVAAIAGSKPGIVWDAGGVTGRDVWSARGNGKKVRLRTGRNDEDATLLTVSPNGRRIAWWLVAPGQTALRDLVVARTAGGRGRNVTEKLDGKVVTAKFTGDSKHVLFIHEDAATGRADLWRANARGKGLRNLTAELTGTATGTIHVSQFDAEVLVVWEFADRTGLVLADVRRGVPTVLDTDLPEGAPGGYAFWPEAGVLHFTWRETGAEKDDLWQRDETNLERRVTEIDSARGLATEATVAVRGVELLLVEHDDLRTFPAPARILRVSRGIANQRPVVAVEGDGRVRVYELDSHDEPRELLPQESLDEVEEIVVAVEQGFTYVTGKSEGVRRLFFLVPSHSSTPGDLADGLPGRVGALRTLLPTGGLIFSMVAEHGSFGEFHVSRAQYVVDTLIARTDLVGLPGRAVVSPKSGDVLFNVIAMPEADNRVFLWDRKKDEIRPLTPPNQRPGTFLFTR